MGGSQYVHCHMELCMVMDASAKILEFGLIDLFFALAHISSGNLSAWYSTTKSSPLNSV